MGEIIYLRTQRNTEHAVGTNCVRIEEHSAGDKWFYDVYDGAGGIVIRVFDPIEVHFEWSEDE